MSKTEEATMTVEEEILDATGEAPRSKKESQAEYLKRLLTASNDENTVPEKRWAKLSEGAQGWATEAAKAFNSKKPLPDFPEAEDGDDTGEEDTEEEKPKGKGKPKAEDAEDDENDGEDEDGGETEDDEDDEDDENDEEKPAPKKTGKRPAVKEDDSGEETEDEEKGKDEEEKPVKRGPGRPPKIKKEEKEELPDPEEAKKKAADAVKALRRICCINAGLPIEKIKARLEKKGHTVTDKTLELIYGDVQRTLKMLDSLNMLKEYEPD